MTKKRKQQRARRHRPAGYLGLRPAPTAELHWTPLQQKCGCVLDWGWDGKSDPAAFITWCIQMTAANCPWHGAESGHPVDAPPDAVLDMHDPTTGQSFYARRATGPDLALGHRIGADLRELTQKIVREDRAGILAEIPAVYRERISGLGHDPVDAWIDQRLADLVLNRGNSPLPDLLARLEGHQ